MIEEGKVKLLARNGFSFVSYKQGDIFGENEALSGSLRDSKATASIYCILHAVKIDSINDLLHKFPDVAA